MRAFFKGLKWKIGLTTLCTSFVLFIFTWLVLLILLLFVPSVFEQNWKGKSVSWSVFCTEQTWPSQELCATIPQIPISGELNWHHARTIEGHCTVVGGVTSLCNDFIGERGEDEHSLIHWARSNAFRNRGGICDDHWIVGQLKLEGRGEFISPCGQGDELIQLSRVSDGLDLKIVIWPNKTFVYYLRPQFGRGSPQASSK